MSLYHRKSGKSWIKRVGTFLVKRGGFYPIHMIEHVPEERIARTWKGSQPDHKSKRHPYLKMK